MASRERRNMMDGHDPPLPIHFTKKYFDKLPLNSHQGKPNTASKVLILGII